MNKLEMIENYQHHLNGLESLIYNSPYKIGFFIEKLKINKATFYRRLRNKTFDVEEVKTITKILYPEQNFLTEIKQELENSRQEIKEGQGIPYDMMRKHIEKVEKDLMS